MISDLNLLQQNPLLTTLYNLDDSIIFPIGSSDMQIKFSEPVPINEYLGRRGKIRLIEDTRELEFYFRLFSDGAYRFSLVKGNNIDSEFFDEVGLREIENGKMSKILPTYVFFRGAEGLIDRLGEKQLSSSLLDVRLAGPQQNRLAVYSSRGISDSVVRERLPQLAGFFRAKSKKHLSQEKVEEQLIKELFS